MEPVEGETIRTIVWKMMLPIDGFKPRLVHIPAFMEDAGGTNSVSSPGLTGRPSIPELLAINREAAAYWVPGQAGDDKEWGSAHAFFFTSLMLENVMPSARSLV
jgi:hypothetical protein